MPLDVLTDTRTDHGLRAGAGGWVDGYGHVSADLARSLAHSLAADAWAVTAPGIGPSIGPGDRVTGSRPAVTSSQARSCARSTSDHITPAAEGGPITAENGQGYCEACNHTRQAPGWTTKARTDPDGTHVVETTTPTGHTYDSRPPPAD